MSTGRTSGVDAFWWTLTEFCAGELLPYVFADAEDERHQYTMVVHQVTTRLRRDATPAGAGRRGRASTASSCRTYDELVDLIVDRLDRRRRPAPTGPARSPASAPSTRSSAGCASRCGRCGR